MGPDEAADRRHLLRALELAARGEGLVEPNPMVGCVLVRREADGRERVIGEGWHRRFGDRHAETEALAACSEDPAGATAYVTLEPCSHHGKQPPCADALIAAKIGRVVAAMADPFPQVAGRGLARLREAGIATECGRLEAEARSLNAPYLKRLATGLPWVIAKWAMTLDGRIAAASGDSRWISGEASRSKVPPLRGLFTAVVVGSGTVAADDPLLTARPAGPRVAVRVVLDSAARLAPTSQLVRTIDQGPVVLVCGPPAPLDAVERLREAGVDVRQSPLADPTARAVEGLRQLAKQGATNVLIEGGERVVGSLLDAELIDEVFAFVAPKLIGGHEAPGPVGGRGRSRMAEAFRLNDPVVTRFGDDLLIRGRIDRNGGQDSDEQRHTGRSERPGVSKSVDG